MAVYKDNKTGKWFTQYRYKNQAGEKKRGTKRGFSTKREALQWEREFLLKKSGSIDMTFAAFAKRYEEDISVRIKNSTRENKKFMIEKNIVPFFGEMKLCEITTADIMRWQNIMLGNQASNRGKPYSKSYLRTLHNQLSAIFNHGVRFYNLKENPATIVGNMGTNNEIRMKFWTLEDYRKFSESMMDKPVSYYCFEILYWCGLRLGEMLGLTTADIDFAAKTISVNKTYYRSKGIDHVTSPKTTRSVRTIIMPDFLSDELKDYLKLCVNVEPEERMFNVSKGYIQHEMARGIKEQKLEKIRVHDLRHSHVSLLIDMGYSAVAIAERLGHESIDITYRYAHMFPTVERDMAKKLNELNELKEGK